MQPDRAFAPAFLLLGILLLVGPACLDSTFLAGKECDEERRCLEGYVCDTESNTCISIEDLPLCGQRPYPFCDGEVLVTCEDGREYRETCPLGCYSAARPDRCFRLDPSNLIEPERSLVCSSKDNLIVHDDAILHSDSGILSSQLGDVALEHFTVVPQSGPYARDLGVFSFHRVVVHAGATLRISGDNAVAILACSYIRIEGVVDVSGGPGEMRGDGTATPGTGGPGGFRGGDRSGGDGEGPGGGTGGEEAGCDVLRDSGGAGGGFGGIGGTGGSGVGTGGCSASGPEGGTTSGTAGLEPLLGGSGGGGGADFSGGPGGGGGGAVQLVAGNRIEIVAGGGILAGGGGGAGGHDGNDASAGGGGGSGGGILLEAAEVIVSGILGANGGGGGAGFFENDEYTDRVAEPGAGGGLGTEPAAGGIASGLGGDGGDGSGGSSSDGGDGRDNENGGGGGGGAGRIRIHSLSGAAQTTASTRFSPSDERSRCLGLCSLGVVKTW